MVKRDWRHMNADEKIETLRIDNERLFSLTNKYESQIKELESRLDHVERFLSSR